MGCDFYDVFFFLSFLFSSFVLLFFVVCLMLSCPYSCFQFLPYHFLIYKLFIKLLIFFNFTPMIFKSFKFGSHSINCYLFYLRSFKKKIQISSSLCFFLLNFISILFVVVVFSFSSFLINSFSQFHPSQLNLLRVKLFD
jgi:hypothetical protein